MDLTAIDLSRLDSACFNGSYRELVELIGHENTLKLYQAYGGQYLPLPKKLLSDAYLHQRMYEEYDGTNAVQLAKKYGYTYSWVRKVFNRLSRQEEGRSGEVNPQEEKNEEN